jgi:hypothetical protein
VWWWCGGFFTDYNTTPTKVVLSCFGLLVVITSWWCGGVVVVGGFFTDYNTKPTKVVLSCFGLLVGLWQYIGFYLY